MDSSRTDSFDSSRTDSFQLGARIEDTIAFGDAKVDIPMFECCAFSVCMGSGGDEAEAAADYVTAGVDDPNSRVEIFKGCKHWSV